MLIARISELVQTLINILNMTGLQNMYTKLMVCLLVFFGSDKQPQDFKGEVALIYLIFRTM